MASSIITVERLREVIDYDHERGVFVRKVRLAQRHKVGDRADYEVGSGGLKGYCMIGIDSRAYLAHRLAWLYVHGEWPENDIDHINGCRNDNRISNLRDVTNSVNRQNMRKSRSDSKSGLLGAATHLPGVFRARVQLKGRLYHIGVFDSAEKAHEAYVKAKRLLHEGCTI